MTGIVIGIDPGSSGAMSVIMNGQLVSCEDMPTDPVLMRTLGKESVRFRVSPYRLADMLRPFANNTDLAPFKMLMEMPTYRPRFVNNRETGRKEARQMGSQAVASLAENVGMIRGLAGAFRIPFHGISVSTWKRALNVPAEKQLSRKRAQEIFPQWTQSFARVKDDGRAESALIAFYGWSTTTQPE